METIGLTAVFEDSDFQAGLKAYSDGLAKMERTTAQALKSIGVLWDEQNKTFRKGGVAISESRVAEELDKLKAKFPPVVQAANEAGKAISALGGVGGGAGVRQAGEAAATSTNKFRAFGETVDRSGRQAMIGMRSIGEIANLVGLNAGLSQTIYTAANAADSIGDLSGALAMLSPALLAVTAIGAGAAVVFSIIQEQSKHAAEEAAKIKAPFEEARKQIQALIELKGIDLVAKEMGVTVEALTKYASQGIQANRVAQDYNTLMEQRALKEAELTKAQEGVANAQAYINRLIAEGRGNEPIIAQLKLAYEEGSVKVQALTSDIQKLNIVLNAQTTAIRVPIQTEQINALQKSVAQAVIDSNAKIRTIESSLADDRTRIWESAANSIANIQSGLSRTLAGYDRDYARAMEGFAKDEVRIGQDAAKAISDAYRDAAKDAAAAIADAARESAEVEKDRLKSLGEVDRDSAKSLSRVNFDEAKSLAKVDSDLKEALRNSRSAKDRRALRRQAAERKKEIAEEAAQRRKEIEEAAAERKQDIEEQAAERQQQIAERKQERLAEIEARKQEQVAEIEERRREELRQLDERKQQAAKELAQRKADAKAAADEQIAQAKRSAAQQVQEAEDRAAKEKQIVRDELDQMAADVDSKIKALGGTVAADGLALGTSTINGYVAGIKAGQPQVTAAIQEVVNAAIKAANTTTTTYPWGRPTYDTKSYDIGGWVNRTGPAIVHAGEYVLNPMQARLMAPVLASPNYSRTTYNFSHTWNGSAGTMDRREIERIVETATYRSIRQVVGAN